MERQLELEAARGRILVEESRESVVVLDEQNRVVAASRRARESVEGLAEGARAPDAVLAAAMSIAYQVHGRRERLLYLSSPGDLAAYEELRAGFTAAVSHELRTPLARVLALLETALLPGERWEGLVEQARAEVEQTGELIDDVLFLAELETGRTVSAPEPTAVLPLLERVASDLDGRAGRAGVTLRAEGDADAALALRPRMLAVVAQNLAENSIRYAGPGSTCVLSVTREGGSVVVRAADDGVGVVERDLGRLFERFYRADRARASRGTGLGLAIVKHVVTAAGGSVEASGGRGRGLQVTCRFPAA